MAEGKRVVAIAIDGSDHSENALQCKLHFDFCNVSLFSTWFAFTQSSRKRLPNTLVIIDVLDCCSMERFDTINRTVHK